MNKIVNNLAQIADAAEYFDKKTGAAWKIRSALTNMIVWACNSHLYALKSDSAERLASSMVAVATLRTWIHDSNCNAFVLDCTPAAVRKTLGLERIVDVHAEAVRIARQKCLQTRSSLQFKKYYEAAIAAFEEQRLTREQSVEAIAEMISDNEFAVSHDVASHFETFMNMAIAGTTVSDADLYDDGAVERQADTLAEVIGNALEAMYDVCDAELAAAITSDKVNRLSGYLASINNMMVITGVDMTKLADRRVKLEALIDAQISVVDKDAEKLNAEILVQLNEQMKAPSAEATQEANKAAKMQRVKKSAAV
jgi:hypothetical protein